MEDSSDFQNYLVVEIIFALLNYIIFNNESFKKSINENIFNKINILKFIAIQFYIFILNKKIENLKEENKNLEEENQLLNNNQELECDQNLKFERDLFKAQMLFFFKLFKIQNEEELNDSNINAFFEAHKIITKKIEYDVQIEALLSKINEKD